MRQLETTGKTFKNVYEYHLLTVRRFLLGAQKTKNRLLDHRGTGHVSLANMGAFMVEVHNVRGVACREMARLQDLMEEAAVRRPEEPSLNLSDFKVSEGGSGGSFVLLLLPRLQCFCAADFAT